MTQRTVKRVADLLGKLHRQRLTLVGRVRQALAALFNQLFDNRLGLLGHELLILFWLERKRWHPPGRNLGHCSRVVGYVCVSASKKNSLETPAGPDRTA